MASLVFLSEKDRNLLQGLIDRERDSRVNTPSRPQQERSYAEAEDHQSPEVYIALPPVEGIPALDVGDLANTGTGDDEGTPGSAECDIYKIVEGELVRAGFTKLVYNLSPRDIPREIEIEREAVQTVVTQVCFDEADCILTVCDREMCFPLGTKISPEDCGDAGTGTGECDFGTGTGTDLVDSTGLNFIIIQRDKFGTWVIGVPILGCESPLTGTEI